MQVNPDPEFIRQIAYFLHCQSPGALFAPVAEATEIDPVAARKHLPIDGKYTAVHDSQIFKRVVAKQRLIMAHLMPTLARSSSSSVGGLALHAALIW